MKVHKQSKSKLSVHGCGLLLTGLLLISSGNARAMPFFDISFEGQPGEFISQGMAWSFTSGGVFDFSVSRNFDNGISFSWNNFGNVPFTDFESWGLRFAAPGDATIVPGLYEDATRFPFQDIMDPGLTLSGDGRGCNTSIGQYDVGQVSYAPNGDVTRFSATFEQRCTPGIAPFPMLTGQITFIANVMEPSTIALLGAGFLGIGIRRKVKAKVS